MVNEKSLVLFIRHLLKDHPTPVVYDQKSSSAIKRAVVQMGGTPVPERSGHAFIKRHFLEVGAAVAGEVSGHFFFGELGYDDGLFAALLMADIIAGSERSLSQMTSDIVCPPITPDLRVACPYAEQQSWLDRVEALAKDRLCEVSHLDGVRLEFAGRLGAGAQICHCRADHPEGRSGHAPTLECAAGNGGKRIARIGPRSYSLG